MGYRAFTVYDMDADPQGRWTQTDDGLIRLEHCSILKYDDGAYELRVRIGWPAGSHYDGGELTRAIPRRWFELSWEEFLVRFASRFPKREYLITADDLAQAPGLRDFLGFASEREDDSDARALFEAGLGHPVVNVKLYYRKDGLFLADADGALCFVSGGEVYVIGCHPYEPCTYLMQDGEVTHAIHNAFYPDEFRRLARNGGTTEAITGNSYDIERMCGMLDHVVSNDLFSCSIDETEFGVAIERMRALGALSPETAVDAAALGLRGFPVRLLRGGKKKRARICETDDGRFYLPAAPEQKTAAPEHPAAARSGNRPTDNYCRQCGAKRYGGNARYCTQCGARFV